MAISNIFFFLLLDFMAVFRFMFVLFKCCTSGVNTHLCGRPQVSLIRVRLFAMTKFFSFASTFPFLVICALLCPKWVILFWFFMFWSSASPLCATVLFGACSVCIYVYVMCIKCHTEDLCSIQNTIDLPFKYRLSASLHTFAEFLVVHFMFGCAGFVGKKWTTSLHWVTTPSAPPPRCPLTLTAISRRTSAMAMSCLLLQCRLEEGMCALVVDQTSQGQLLPPPSPKLRLCTRLGVQIGPRQKC